MFINQAFLFNRQFKKSLGEKCGYTDKVLSLVPVISQAEIIDPAYSRHYITKLFTKRVS